MKPCSLHRIPSPIGTLFLAATGEGLCRMAWYLSESEFVAALGAERARSHTAWMASQSRGRAPQ